MCGTLDIFMEYEDLSHSGKNIGLDYLLRTDIVRGKKRE